MPPRKKQRLSPPAASSEQSTPAAKSLSAARDGPSPAEETASPTSAPEPAYWEPASLTALFKSLIRHKPTGPHKHFHMLSIVQDVSASLGYRIPTDAIWTKLNELYDLRRLDEKETVYAFGLRDAKGQWDDSVVTDFHMAGDVVKHGPGSQSGDELDEERIGAQWRPKDENEAYFVNEVYLRRFDNEDHDELGDAGPEASPAPSTAPSTTRKTGPGARKERQARGRPSSIVAAAAFNKALAESRQSPTTTVDEDEGDGDGEGDGDADEDDEDDDDEDGKGRGRGNRGRRRSARKKR